MAGLPTIEMFKGEKRLICNEADEAQFAEKGWGREVAAPEPAPEKVDKPAPIKKRK